MHAAIGLSRPGVTTKRPQHRVLLVGGPDVDARLELMHALSTTFEVSALGSRSDLRNAFSAAGFGYSAYRLSRQVNPALDLLTMGQLMIRFRRLKPQIVHTFDTKPGIWGCLAARLAGVPVVVCTVTGLGSLYATGGARTRLTRAVYQILQTLACCACNLVLFQNREDACHFAAERMVSPTKIMIMPGSGVSTEVFDPARVPPGERTRVRAELGLWPDDIVVTMISRVIRSKGILEFAAAAREACHKRPQVRFVLIGDEDRDSLDRLTKHELEGVQRILTWPGPRQDIAAVLAASDLFVFPSYQREGIPRVLLEAAAMALPIVTADAPGCNEVVEHDRNGLLVPVRDPRALAEAIIRLVDSPELRQRHGRAARARAEEQFALSVVAGKIRNIYQRLLASKGLTVDGQPVTEGTG